MADYTAHASWILIATWTLSVAYEVYRATLKAGVSESDSFRSWVSDGLVIAFVLGFASALLLQTGWTWTVWLALAITLIGIGVSIFYYGPVMLPARQPGLIDHIEDKVFTGLLFVAAALLAYHLAGTTLSP